MADDIERLVLQMSADIRRLDKNTADGQRRFDRRLTEMEARARQADRNLSRIMDDAGRNMVGSLQRSLTAIAPTLAAAFSADQVIKYADSYTQLQNRLKAAGLEGEALKRVEDALYETANRNGLQVQATAELYQRASLSRQRLGASESELLALVSGTAAALKVQGTSAEAASGPLLQLGQVLGGAKVQAEEYNSLIDGLPVLLQAAAKGSARFGGDVAKLTTAVKAGEVTSQEFFQALLKGFPEIERQAAGAATTVGSALQTLDNELGRYIGQTDSSLSATQRLAEAILVLSRNLDTVTTVVGLVATVVGGRFVVQMLLAAGATTAATIESVRYQAALLALEARQKGVSAATVLATAATRGFTAAIAANPIGAVLVAVTALAAGLFVLASRFNTTAIASRQLDQVVGAADETLERYRQAVEKAKSASDEERKGLDAKAAALRRVTLARINDAKVAAQQQIDEAVAARQRADEQIRRAGATRQAVGTNAGSNAGSALVGGARASAQGAIALAVRARGEADTAIQAYERLKSVMEDIENPPAIGSPPAVAGEDGKGKKSSGPTPEELARQRELLALQGQIELLRAQGRTAEADAVQRRLDIANLEKQYADAGIENARAAAELQVNAVAQAEAAVRGRATAQERANELLDMAVEAQRNISDLALDELSLRVEIARLLGDEAGVAAAQREYDIVRRTADLKAKGVSAPKAERQATDEADRLRGAEIVGDLGSAFQDPLEIVRERYAEIERLRQDDVLSEQEAAAAKAQANAMYEEQRLANASGFFGTLAELQDSSNKELAALGKAAAIAQATMDGYVAVQKALASAPPPFNYALAAAVGVVAAANVAKIAGMADGGLVRGPGGPRDDKVLRRLSAGEFVVNAQATAQNRALLEAINNGRGIPGLANGGIVGIPALPDLTGLARPSSSSLTYAPSIDARGADLAAVNRLEAILAEERRQFSARVMGVIGQKQKYRLGRNSED